MFIVSLPRFEKMERNQLSRRAFGARPLSHQCYKPLAFTCLVPALLSS